MEIQNGQYNQEKKNKLIKTSLNELKELIKSQKLEKKKKQNIHSYK